MPLVFLSYHTDDGPPFVDKLHADLEDRLYQQWGPPRDAHVFRDKPAIKLGERWPDELGAALARANLLLCLFSPVYFTRPWCGKEIGFFQQRLEAYRVQNELPAPPPLLLPLLWVPERKGGLKFPEAFRNLQWNQDFPESYTKVGLQQIIKLSSRYAADYEDIVGKVVDRILEAIADTPLPEHAGPVDFDAIPDAFAEAMKPGAGAPPPRPARGGPKRVLFFVVAGPRSELEKAHLRGTLSSYGESGTDWDPFCPPPDPWPISALAQHVASTPELNLTSEIVVPSDDLIARLEKARADNNLVVFIVDPWTLRIQEYSDRLREYDRRDFLNSAVLVAANEGDEETRQCADLLETAIRATFENKTVGQKVRWSRVSRDQLQKDLRDALLEVKARIAEQGEVKRKAEAGKVFVRPVISANKG